MKNPLFHARAALAALALIGVPSGVILAADPAPATPEVQADSPQTAQAVEASAPAAVAPAPAPATVPVPPQVPYGVDDVLKLQSAQVNEGVIVNFVQNSGKIYTLKSEDIVYLRNQGVSDGVIAAMLNSKANVMAASQAAQAAQAYASAPTAIVQQPAAVYAQQPVYAEQAPAVVAAPASTVYVIQSPAAQAAYYGRPSSYPYGYGYGGYGYGGYGYGGYYGASVSFGVRIGGGCGYGYYGGNRCYAGRAYCRR